jgi:hypothetical protein
MAVQSSDGINSTLRLLTVDADKPAQPRGLFVCSDPCIGGDSFAASPDGRFAAVTESRRGGRVSSVVLVDLATGASHKLPGIPGGNGICCVTWSAAVATMSDADSVGLG